MINLTAITGIMPMSGSCGSGYLQADPPMSYSVGGMLRLLKERGPLWVTTDEDPTANFAIHARVVTGMFGNGSPGGTFLRINDPAGGVQRIESFRVFMQKFEEVAAGDLAAGGKFRIQVVHF
jgi:hypothetical protein